MRLIQLFDDARTWRDDDTTIYLARPWCCDADAILVSPSPDGTTPIEQDGRRYEYFLETFIACEVIEGLPLRESADEAFKRRTCERLIDYAESDA